MLDADAQRFVEEFIPPGAEAPPQSVEEARGLVLGLGDLIGPGPDMDEVADLRIPVEGQTIGARLYVPAPDPVATVVFFHGGGWVIGDLDGSDAFCRMLARDSGCRVVSVDYRRAPESPFPTGLDDSFAALCWVAANVAEGSPLIVCGDSSGGNFAAACARRARDAGFPEIALQLLAYPVLDHDFETDSYREFGDDRVLSRAKMEWFWEQYLGSDGDRDDPDASPLREADLAGLAPVYLVAPECDVLRSEGLRYVRRLREAGVEVTLDDRPGQFHGFITMVNVLPAADRAVGAAAEAIRARIGLVNR